MSEERALAGCEGCDKLGGADGHAEHSEALLGWGQGRRAYKHRTNSNKRTNGNSVQGHQRKHSGEGELAWAERLGKAGRPNGFRRATRQPTKGRHDFWGEQPGNTPKLIRVNLSTKPVALIRRGCLLPGASWVEGCPGRRARQAGKTGPRMAERSTGAGRLANSKGACFQDCLQSEGKGLADLAS